MIPNFKDYNTKNVKWSYDKLKTYLPFNRNRDVEPRVPKLTKILSKKYSPTQIEYKVGLVVKPFEHYKKGEMFILDGNTRTAVYKKRADLIPPCDFDVKIYELENFDEAKTLYYSIDNSDAAEKSGEKITGLHREKDFKPISKVFKKGSYITALNIASRYAHNENGLYLQNTDVEPKLNYFWNEIQFLDNYNLNSYMRTSISVLGCFLMIIKKYGTNNPNVNKLLETFKGGITTISNGNEVDGVHYIYHEFYTEKILTWSQSSYGKSMDLVCPILYCLDLFVNGVTIKKNGNKVILPKQEVLKEFYQFYID